MVTVQLKASQGKARYFEMLIDSGADYTLIPKTDALLLGIDYNSIDSQEIKVEVANLAFIHTKRTNIILTIHDIEISIPVLIAKEEVECLLGRKGVFDVFDVIFQESKNQVVFIKN